MLDAASNDRLYMVVDADGACWEVGVRKTTTGPAPARRHLREWIMDGWRLVEESPATQGETSLVVLARDDEQN